MQLGSAPYPPQGSPVLVPSARVTINGSQVQADSVRVTREISTDLPGQVVGGGEIVAATGEVVLSGDVAAGSAPAHPWDDSRAWPPREGARVLIDLGMADQVDGTPCTVRALQGRADDVTGSLSARQVTVPIVDDIDSLARVVSIPARVRQLPITRPQPSALGVLVEAAAKAGYRTGPAVGPSTVLSVPMWAGTVLPEIGYSITDAWASSEGHPDEQTWGMAPWGWAPLGGQPWQYEIRSPAIGGAGRTIDTTWDMAVNTSSIDRTFVLRPPSAGAQAWSVRVRNEDVRGPVTIDVAGPAAAGSVNTPATATFAFTQWPAWIRLSVRLIIGSSGSWTLLLWAMDMDANKTAPSGTLTPLLRRTGTGATVLATTGATAPHWRLDLPGGAGNKAYAAGFVVNAYATPATNPEQRTGASLWSPSRVRVQLAPGDESRLSATPAVVGRVASEVIKEIAAATLTAVWIDELGVLQVVGRNALRSRPVSATITTTSSVLDATWSRPLGQARHAAVVKTLDPVITEPANGSEPAAAGVTVYVAPPLTLQPGETWVEWVHVPEEEEWVDVATTLTPEAAIPAWSQTGSWLGKNGSTNRLDGRVEQIDARTYKITLTAPASNTGPVENLISQGFPQFGARGTPTPLLRATRKVTWTETAIAGKSVGPDYAQDLVHEAGPWAQSVDLGTSARRLADDVADLVTKPVPQVDSVEVVPDWRTQLGDRVTVKDPRTSVTLDAVVAGITNAVDPGAATQSLTLRVLAAGVDDATSASPTYAALADRWAGRTYTDLATAWADKTYASLATQGA